jgi:Capsule polysaccharide biosynthesis protein
MNNGKKRVLIYSPLALWRFHIATDVEIAQRYLDDGHEVYWVACRTELPICQANPDNLKSICMACERRSVEGLEWLWGERLHVMSLDNLTDDERVVIREIDEAICRDTAMLSEYEMDGSDIGLAVLSSLISQISEPEPDLNQYADVISMHLQAALTVHFSIKRYITDILPDEIILFNGRFSSNRPALRAAQKSSARVVTHERAFTQGRYLIVEDDYPHALELAKHSISNHWNGSRHDLNIRKDIAARWFRSQREGKDMGWFSFVARQKPGTVPSDLDTGKVNIAIFVSSEDEYYVLKGWQNVIYKNENDGICQLIDSFKRDKRYHFYIRIHPNMAGVDNSQTRGLLSFRDKSDSVTVIDAGSPVDTYALIEASDIVLTFGSTVGIEAAYMGKPSMVLGRAFYEDLGGVMRLESHDEVIEEIKKFAERDSGIHLEIPDGAYKYGYYLMTAGEPFKYVIQDAVGIKGIRRGNKTVYFKLSWAARLVWVLEKALRMIGVGGLIKKRSPAR